MIETALFPIPDCVAFPNTTVPLHVFEPRYRSMVRHCVDHNMPLAVCHTEKVISPAPEDQSVIEALQRNQATYKPCPIFSAGHCEIVQTLNDGRMAIQIHMQKRLKLIAEIQTLPFTIAQCEEVDDAPLLTDARQSAIVTQEKIIKRLQAIIHKSPEAIGEFKHSHWQSLPPENFSFDIFNLLRLPADFAQRLLETCDINQRLESILEILNQDIAS